MSDFAVYGRYGALDMIKILSQGVGTFSTPGKPNSEIFCYDFLDPPPPGLRPGAQYPRILD